jgi:hypothetical protein
MDSAKTLYIYGLNNILIKVEKLRKFSEQTVYFYEVHQF